MLRSREKREFLRAYVPEYRRVKAVAKENPRLFAQFQSRIWLLWISRWYPELRVPDPNDAAGICHWNRSRQKVSSSVMAQINRLTVFALESSQDYSDASVFGSLLC